MQEFVFNRLIYEFYKALKFSVLQKFYIGDLEQPKSSWFYK